MATQLQTTQTFNFHGSSIRTITDERNGNNWFVLKDLCDILGLTNTSQTAICVKRNDHNDITKIKIGKQGAAWVVTEAGLYYVIIMSRKQAAIPFKEWMLSQVLPQIRKTGQYQMAPVAQPVQQPVTQLSLAEIATEAKAIHDLATLFGLTGNQALLRTDKIVHERHGVSPLKLLNVDLVAPSKEKTFNPTNLGLQLNPTKTGQWVNNRLQELGFQDKVKIRFGHEWNPTPMGRQHCEVIDTGKAHSNGAPILQIKWYHSVLQYLGDL